MPTLVFCCGATLHVKSVMFPEEIESILAEEIKERRYDKREATRHRKRSVKRGFLRHRTEKAVGCDGKHPYCYECPCRHWAGYEITDALPDDFWEQKDTKYSDVQIRSLMRPVHTCFPLTAV